MHAAPVIGALAALALGLTLGAGSADASRGAMLGGSVRQVDLSGPLNGLASTGRQRRTVSTQPSSDDNPIRFQLRTPTNAFVAPHMWPMPPYMLPSDSTPVPVALPISLDSSASAIRSPAPQALLHVAIAARTSTTQMRGLRSAHSDSPPRAGMRANNPLLALAKITASGLSFAGLQGPGLGLSMTLSTNHDRAERMSSLGLEHVLDRQTAGPASRPVVVAANIGQSDAGISLRRHPDATGLKLTTVHPRATQYLQWGEHPAPLATPAPAPTFARASLVQPAPTPTPTVGGNWTASTMPGGNATMYFITGYTATGNRTATGTWPHWGTVAVDRHVIPLGSTVYIQGLGVFHAEDTGGAVIGNHIDVFVDSVSQAYQLTGHRLVSFVPPGGTR